MSYLRFLHLLIPIMAFALFGCTSDKDEDRLSETRSAENLISENNTEWNESELESFKQMAAVNDSIANLNFDRQKVQTKSIIDVLNQVIILWADADGLAHGYEYGYHCRNKTEGNIADGLFYAIIFSTLQSAAAYTQIMLESLINIPADPRTGYMYLEYATAKTYLNQNVLIPEQNQFRATFKKTSARASSADPIRIASFHNAAVREFISSLNRVPNPTIINKVFNEEDLANFSSNYSFHIYNNIGYYCKGETPPGLYIAPYIPNAYMAQVLRLYKQGLQNITDRPYSQALSDIDALCCQYSDIVASQTSLDYERKKYLIDALHVAPGSALLWTDIHGSPI